MLPDADLIIGNLLPHETPSDHWCDCGHKAPALFRREGPLSEALPTRFFVIRKRESDGLRTVGTYCEPCMIVAQYLRNQKRKREEIEAIGKRVAANSKVENVRASLLAMRGTKL